MKPKNNPTDKFFNDINFYSILETIKTVYSSDGSMSTLLDFERCLDESDLYGYENWELGELVQGPMVKKYTVACIFMWPYKLMPDPSGAKRLLNLGARVKVKLTHVKVPMHVDSYEDFIQGTRYPKMINKKVWLFYVELPRDLMDDIKEGSIDLAGQKIDLGDLADSYADDLEEDGNEQEQDQDQMSMGGPSLGGLPPLPPGPGGPPMGLPPGPGGL
jgi:hypothetical protein